MEKRLIIILVSLIALIGLVSPATYHDSISVDTGDGKISVGNEGSCEEHWISFWGECINNEQKYICYDENSCDTEEAKPEKCGDIRECETSDSSESDSDNEDSSSGSSSSSRSSSSSSSSSSSFDSETAKTEDSDSLEWECEEWSECIEGKQTRVCVEVNGNAETKTETKQCSSVQKLNNEEENSSGFGSKITGAFSEVLNLNKSGVGIAFLILSGLLIVVLIVAMKKYQ